MTSSHRFFSVYKSVFTPIFYGPEWRFELCFPLIVLLNYYFIISYISSFKNVTLGESSHLNHPHGNGNENFCIFSTLKQLKIASNFYHWVVITSWCIVLYIYIAILILLICLLNKWKHFKTISACTQVTDSYNPSYQTCRSIINIIKMNQIVRHTTACCGFLFVIVQKKCTDTSNRTQNRSGVQ